MKQILSILLLPLAILYSSVSSESRTFSIADSTDIMEQDVTASTNNVDWECLGSDCGTLWLGMFGTYNVNVGLRFPGVNIPPGATINSAVLEVKSNGDHTDTVSISIFGEASSYSQPFSKDGINGIVNRNLTNAVKSFEITDDWDGDDIFSANVTELINEIASQPSWINGNPMTFIVKDNSGFTDTNCPTNSLCKNTRTINGFKSSSYGGSDDEFMSPRLTINYSIDVVNYAPTDIYLNNNTIDENMPAGSYIGQLGVNDLDSNDSHNFYLPGENPFNAYFHIDGNILRTSAEFNYEIRNEYLVTIVVVDNVGNWLNKNFTIYINDVEEDTSMPTVTNVNAREGNGFFGEGSYIDILITFSEAIQVNGTPQLTLETGENDMIVDCFHEGETTLNCRYEVSSGHQSSDLSYINSASLQLNGAAIFDNVDNPAILTLPLPGDSTSLSYNNDIVIDTDHPTVNLSTSSKAVTNVSPIPVTAIFSEDIQNFNSASIPSFDNGIPGNFVKISDQHYTFEVTPNYEGNVSIHIYSGVFTDKAGNWNVNSNLLNINYDISPPGSPNISSSVTGGATSTTPIPFTIEFWEEVEGFTEDDISVSNGNIKEGSFTRSGYTFQIEVIPLVNGDVTVKVPAGKFSDAAGNMNTYASNDYTVNYDNVIPSPSFSSNVSSPTNSGYIQVYITFSTNCQNLSVGSIEKGGLVSLSNFYQTSDNSYQFDAIPLDDGEITFNLSAGSCQSDKGNSNTAAVTSLSILYDGSQPIPSASVNGNQPVEGNTIPIIISFSEDVFGFKQSDLVVSNGDISNFSGAGNLFSFDLNPWASATYTSISAGYGVCLDAATNQNQELSPVNIYKDSFGYWCDEKNQLEGGYCVDPTLFNDLCGVPNGDNSCIPQVTQISPADKSELDYPNPFVDIYFSNYVSSSSEEGISVTSHSGIPPQYNVYQPNGNQDVLRIDFSEVTPEDTLSIGLNASKIRAQEGDYKLESNGFLDGPGNSGDNMNFQFYLPPVDYCDEAYGNNNCIPLMNGYSNDENTSLPLNGGELEIYFSHDLDGTSADAVQLISLTNSPLNYTVDFGTGNQNTMRVLFHELTSLDTLELTMDASNIRSMDGEHYLDTNDFLDPPGSEADNVTAQFTVQILGDYDVNGSLDGGDVDVLLTNWNSGNYEYELGPVTGGIPFFTPDFDGIWDIQDLMVFVRTWNYLYFENNFNRIQKTVANQGIEPEIRIEKGNILLTLPESVKPITRIWYEVEGEIDSQLEYPAQQSLDMFLPIQNAGSRLECILADFSAIQNESIILGKTGNSDKLNNTIRVSYELVSGTEVITSGSQRISADEFPQSFALKKIYPNPFNPVTTVEYALSTAGLVRLSVYSAEGRLISYLVNNEQPAGNYREVWEADRVSSGVYFIRLQVFGENQSSLFSQTQRLILMK